MIYHRSLILIKILIKSEKKCDIMDTIKIQKV